MSEQNVNTPHEGIAEIFTEDRFFDYWYPYPGYSKYFEKTSRFGLLVTLFDILSKTTEKKIDDHEFKPWWFLRHLVKEILDKHSDHKMLCIFLTKVLAALEHGFKKEKKGKELRPIFTTWFTTNNSITEDSVRVASNYNDGYGSDSLKGKTRIVRINAFFLRLNTLLGTDKALREKYIMEDKTRRALLTTGAILFYKKDSNNLNITLDRVLNFQEFIDCSDAEYFKILRDIFESHRSENKFVDFWGGCKMEIPDHVLTGVDQNIYMLKLEVFSRKEIQGQENNPQMNDYFLVQEHPLHLNYTRIGNVVAKYASDPDPDPDPEQKFQMIPKGFSVNTPSIGNQYYGEYYTRIIESRDIEYIYLVKCPLFNPELDLLTSVQLFDNIHEKDHFHEICLSST